MNVIRESESRLNDFSWIKNAKHVIQNSSLFYPDSTSLKRRGKLSLGAPPRICRNEKTLFFCNERLTVVGPTCVMFIFPKSTNLVSLNLSFWGIVFLIRLRKCHRGKTIKLSIFPENTKLRVLKKKLIRKCREACEVCRPSLTRPPPSISYYVKLCRG